MLIEVDKTVRDIVPWELYNVSAPTFLLIQGFDVLDYNKSPVQLTWGLADKQQDIIVAVGVTNEYRKKEIVGIVGHYHYIPFARRWLVNVGDNIQVEMDVTGKPGIVLRDSLYQLKAQGKLSDPLNMSKVIIRGIR